MSSIVATNPVASPLAWERPGASYCGMRSNRAKTWGAQRMPTTMLHSQKTLPGAWQTWWTGGSDCGCGGSNWDQERGQEAQGPRSPQEGTVHHYDSRDSAVRWRHGALSRSPMIGKGEIVKASYELGVTLTERAIERNGARKPGRIIDSHPWKARYAEKCIGDFQTELDRIKKNQSNHICRRLRARHFWLGGHALRDVGTNCPKRGRVQARWPWYHWGATKGVSHRRKDHWHRRYGVPSRVCRNLQVG